jgi:hypothetical protein
MEAAVPSQLLIHSHVTGRRYIASDCGQLLSSSTVCQEVQFDGNYYVKEFASNLLILEKQTASLLGASET